MFLIEAERGCSRGCTYCVMRRTTNGGMRVIPVNAILERIPAGRWGVPGDLAGPVVFLASKASDYINGYTIAVDGGWLAR